MDKLKMHSVNKVDENVEKIGKLFPNCVTETILDDKLTKVIDFDILRQELSSIVVEGRDERYQFTWPDKKKSILLANAPIAKTLRPCKEESVDFDTTENLYIEGDNLDVLKLLQETYLGEVKMIYIDPPYNTGKDTFVYNDDFNLDATAFSDMSGQYDENGKMLFDIRKSNEANGKFHTDWLNMIYPRLKLSKDLLKDAGIILINMDEHEIANMQKVCNEIFGEANDLGTIIWDKRNPKGDAKGISYQHEYILAFAKDKLSFLETCNMQRPKKNADAIMKKAAQLFAKKNMTYPLDSINRDFAKWMRDQSDFSGGEKAYSKIDDEGNVFRPVSMAWPNKKKAPDDYFLPLIHPNTGKPCPVPDRGWRNPPSTMKLMQEQGLILFGKDETTIPNSKYLLKENMYENIPSLLYYGGSDTDMLEQMGVPFDTPKVVDVCKEHIQAFTSETDIIIDFFSGSATTAHSVMKLNSEDCGNRKFIMVQLPEECDDSTALGKAGFPNICEAGKERIRRAGTKIKEEAGLRAQKLDIGFRVLKCDSTNMKDVYCNPAEYKPSLLSSLANNIKEDRTPEDLLFQVMLDLGVLLSSKIEETTIAGKRVFSVADGYLIACFDENVTEETVKAIAQRKPHFAAFRDNSMANDSVATNFDQILDSYSPSTKKKVL